ncbi:MAG: DNA polymerase III subunit gamma/tau [Eubacteriales bacterium]
MGYKALYRVWRPKTFAELKGQDHITEILKNQIKQEKIAHAYLFSGPRGTGKTSVAKIFARAVNCKNPVDGEPCGECESCKEILNENSIDVIEIDAASNNGVENIRDIRENVNLLPAGSKFKVYIVDEVHMLTIQAFNALLKTLEEPPAHIIFILATTDLQRVPATILSRCQRFDFKRIGKNEIVNLLSKIALKEGISVEDSALSYIAQSAEGGLRDAISLLDQVSAYEGGVTIKNVEKVLGATDSLKIIKIAKATANYDMKGTLLAVQDLHASGADMGVLFKDLVCVFRDMYTLSFISDDIDLKFIGEDVKELKKAGANMGKEALLRTIDILLSKEKDLRYAFSPEILIQTALLSAMSPEDKKQENISERIDKLESVYKNIQKDSKNTEVTESKKEVKPLKTIDIDKTVSPLKIKEDLKAKETFKEHETPKTGNVEWESLVKASKSKAAFLYEHFLRLRFISEDKDVICLSCPEKSSISADILLSSAAKDVIKKLTKEFYGRDMSLIIKVDKEQAAFDFTDDTIEII